MLFREAIPSHPAFHGGFLERIKDVGGQTHVIIRAIKLECFVSRIRWLAEDKPGRQNKRENNKVQYARRNRIVASEFRP